MWKRLLFVLSAMLLAALALASEPALGATPGSTPAPPVAGPATVE